MFLRDGSDLESDFIFLAALSKRFLSSRQAGYSNRQQRQPRPGYKCEVSGRYFIVGGQMAGCRHILTGLFLVHVLPFL